MIFDDNSPEAKKKIGQLLKEGITDATHIVARKAAKKVPLDKGGLQSSQKVEILVRGFYAESQVGYTSEYAPYVHEIPEAALSAAVRARRNSQGRSSRFLSLAAEEINLADILNMKADEIF